MKIENHIKKRRKLSIDHLSRIQGQMETLKKYMEGNKNCADIAQLTTSIAKSFDALRTKTLEGFILNELLGKENISPCKMEKLNRVLNLYKK
jgi:DNA-binding FrmR family transcriptional regulator